MPGSNKPINFIFKKIANLAHNNNNLKQPYKIFFEQTHKFFGEKYILVPTFSSYSHFSPYILFLPLLVPILKNASRFGPCRYIRNGKNWRGKRLE